MSEAYKVDHPHYGTFTVTDIDTIFRHHEPRFDHLRYHVGAEYGEYGAMVVRCLFLGEQALDYLAVSGIAEAYLDEPTDTTRQLFDSDVLSKLDFEVSE